MIKRTRWVIMRNQRTEIFCGLARSYQFKPVDHLGDTAVKTYLSRNKAIAAFERSWRHPEREDFEVVEVVEIIAAKDGDPK